MLLNQYCIILKIFNYITDTDVSKISSKVTSTQIEDKSSSSEVNNSQLQQNILLTRTTTQIESEIDESSSAGSPVFGIKMADLYPVRSAYEPKSEEHW